jgi:hypothetical protein
LEILCIKILSEIIISFIVEERIALLEMDLLSKKRSLTAVVEEAEEMTERILSNLEKKNGLCIRSLSKPLICLMLSFLGGKNSSASSVCKYWLICSSSIAENVDDVKNIKNGTLKTN